MTWADEILINLYAREEKHRTKATKQNKKKTLKLPQKISLG